MQEKNLVEVAKRIRANILIALHCAGSGHSGGSLSGVELMLGAYAKMNYDPKNPALASRDRFYLSAGHKAPLWYITLAELGYYPLEDVATLRKLGSRFQGHPDRHKVPGVELSCGSLGQGLSVAVGDACAAKMNGSSHKVFCLMGDGEQQEGQIWEAVMAASHHKLDNLIGIVDKNGLQIDGNVEEVMSLGDLSAKYKAFGWEVFECDGHDLGQLLATYDKALLVQGKPVAIIAKTIKGKGVSFMENQAGWHGKTPNESELEKALAEIGSNGVGVERMLEVSARFQAKVEADLAERMPKFSQDYWWNTQPVMKVEMKATRSGFGKALADTKNEKVCTIGSDLSGSVKIDQFTKNRPDRKKRFFSMGIAEQSGTSVAAGMSKDGDIPFFSSFGMFTSGRAYDQLHTSIAYGGLNAKIGASHSGITVGEDGATHQALEDIAIVGYLPGITFLTPADYYQTAKATQAAIDIEGAVYIRYGRVDTPSITTSDSPFAVDRATLYKYLGEAENMLDAFSCEFADIAEIEKVDVCLVACGIMVPESLRAAWILDKEFGLKTIVLNYSSIKPFDIKALTNICNKTKIVITAEEHQKGGFGNMVAGHLLALGCNASFGMIGVEDSFGQSAAPWELMKHYGLTAEFIAEKAKNLLDKKK